MFDLPLNFNSESWGGAMRPEDKSINKEPSRKDLLFCNQVLNGLSREMRTKLNDVVAFSYLLNKEEAHGADHNEFSDQIFDSCEQLIALFDNFLDSAAIDAGHTKSVADSCNPGVLFNDLFSGFREVLKSERYKDIVLVIENQIIYSDEVLVDAKMISRVLCNLFQNSLANTLSGYIKAGYFLKDNRIYFTILDSGQGYLKTREFLETRDLSESLEKYNDLYSAVNLTLIRKLTELIEGTISIECNGLTGSGIYLSFPAKPVFKDDNSMDKPANSMITI